MKIKPARHIIKWWLKLTGFAGICLPPRAVYLLPDRMDDQSLIAHETVHWQQYQRYGLVKFYLGYLFLLVRHGYKNHPWEIEARGK